MKLFQRELDLGQAVEFGGLTVFPLLGADNGGVDYLTALEALDVGLVEVSELDSPSVPSLKVTNMADVPVLFVEGQTLIGGDQNRTMNVTILIQAKSQTAIPVSCVEAHRWGAATGRAYESKSKVAPASLRSAKIAALKYGQRIEDMRRSDQGRVWAEVERLEAGHQAFSDTTALDDLQERVEGGLAGHLDSLTPQAHQVGVVCLAGGRVVGLDVFDKASTLEQYLRPIVGGHTVDAALSAPAENVDAVDAIEEFLAQVEAATVERAEAVGLGEEVHLRDAVNGIALELDGSLVHLAAFPASTEPRDRRRSPLLV